MFKTAVEILKARIGLESNNENLLPVLPPSVEVKSLLTDFKDVERILYSTDLDGYISVEETREEPCFAFSGEKARFSGPFLRLSEEASDLRFSLWGNQGFLYRYTLYLLEKKHSIYNLHACALYHEKRNHMYVVTGGAGSGKTVYLLSGLARGLQLFSTETVHFRKENGAITWFMGSLVDNVRLGTLTHHFPQYLSLMETQEGTDEWQKKAALDFSSHRTSFEEISDPEAVTILFPRIEEGRQGFLINPIHDRRKAARALFDNISQKIAETVVLYDRIPIPGLDEKEMAGRRLNQVNALLEHGTVKLTASVLSNPMECWGDILE